MSPFPLRRGDQVANSANDTAFDYDRARAELEAAAHRRSAQPLPADHPWKARLKAFCDDAERPAKTHIAMLGTAILARATNARADLTRIKGHNSARGSYYAPGLGGAGLA